MCSTEWERNILRGGKAIARVTREAIVGSAHAWRLLALGVGAVLIASPVEAGPDGTPSRAPRGASTAIDTRCDRCHRFSIGLTHPTGVPVLGQPDVGLPLEAGRITCSTCHDDRTLQPHGSERSSLGQDPMLRSDSVENLCSQCHDPRSRDVKSLHALGLLTAHLESSKRPERESLNPSVRVARGGSSIDSESSTCLSCHDGSAAVDVGYHIAGERRMNVRGMEGPSSHPIGVVYSTAPSSRSIQLRPRDAVDRRIRLFDQKVGCGTCHSLYSKEEHLLPFRNERSALCLSCHRM